MALQAISVLIAPWAFDEDPLIVMSQDASAVRQPGVDRILDVFQACVFTGLQGERLAGFNDGYLKLLGEIR